MTNTFLQPFYDPDKSYDENFADGPFGEFVQPKQFANVSEPQYEFLGNKLYLPFGIASGPLINSKFVGAAFKMGFDIVNYKNVRAHRYACWPAPNVLPFNLVHDLVPGKFHEEHAPADEYRRPLSILNSCGVPSFDPDFWQVDLRKAIESAGKGQVMIAGIQGTERGEGVAKYIEDHKTVARLMKEVNPPAVELNLSCPNEGHTNFLCYDLVQAPKVISAVKNELGNTPLIIKVGYYTEQQHLKEFIKKVGPLVEGISAINSIQVKVKPRDGKQPFPERSVAGASGHPIRWAGLDMVKRLAQLRNELGFSYEIIGLGGVLGPEDYIAYREVGADVVQAATGAMWSPQFAQDIKAYLHDTA
jgi:dihydroorotate dehydrogenase (NAD+) catalytic subunit